VHEGGFTVEVLDDGALRFIRPDGEPVECVATGSARPPGDQVQMPKGTARWEYRGDRMDLDLAVDLLIQKSRRTRDVPAGM
jgi:hypothetical protein